MRTFHGGLTVGSGGLWVFSWVILNIIKMKKGENLGELDVSRIFGTAPFFGHIQSQMGRKD